MPSCIISYDFNGRQIGNPKPFPKEYKYGLLLADDSLPDAAVNSVVRSFSRLFTTRKSKNQKIIVNYTKSKGISLRQKRSQFCQHENDSHPQLMCNVTVEKYKLSDDGKNVILFKYFLSDNIILFVVANEEIQRGLYTGKTNMDKYFKLKLNILDIDNCTTMAYIPIITKLNK
ncbi:hypothetical protein TSAR_010436 [Trichomalopsis sarcophagae]|uniref:Uncharacterized protein n=1 Tax=Trichomalopsis sarcophagae TaxID=543379 RepID=A0A232ET05_9HYME|nr:hypothetical protein TSAR_010436 [Trichomalopsis sarcophagae]